MPLCTKTRNPLYGRCERGWSGRRAGVADQIVPKGCYSRAYFVARIGELPFEPRGDQLQIRLGFLHRHPCLHSVDGVRPMASAMAQTLILVQIYLTGPRFWAMINSWKLRHPILLKKQSHTSLLQKTALSIWCPSAGLMASSVLPAEARRSHMMPRAIAGSVLVTIRSASSL